MIHAGKILLVLFAAIAIAATAADETEEEPAFVCNSICANERKGLSTPDFLIEYNWNDRVPVCAGLSCDSGTCSELERKLPSFQTDESACKQHQDGLQEAGCKCSGGMSSDGRSSLWITTTTLAAAAVVTMLL